MEERLDEEFELDLVKLWEIIKKYWVLILCVTCVTTIIGFSISAFLLPKEYSTEAKVIVVSNDNTSNAGNISYTEIQTNQKLVTTYAQIIMSERISDIVIDHLDNVITTEEYNNMVKVAALSSTEIMNISVTGGDPIFVSELANEIVAVFLEELNSIMPVENVSILNSAKIPNKPSGPSKTMWTAGGMLVGLMLSALWCLFKIFTDTKIKTVEDLNTVVKYPLIGSIPDFVAEKGLLADSDSLASEAFRALRTNISMRNFDEDIRVVNVVSSLQGEGKSTVIVNLANSFAQMGRKVLIMDLDLKAPTLHKKLKIKNNKGVTDVINKQAFFKDVVIDYKENLDVLTSGTKIPFTSEFLQSSAIKKFIEKQKETYDYIFLDSPPASIVTDGTIVSKMSDGTIIVVANNQVEKRQLKGLNDLLKQFDINVLGVVMTKMPLSKKYGYYNGYYYGYGYHHSDKKSKGKSSDKNKNKKSIDKAKEKEKEHKEK